MLEALELGPLLVRGINELWLIPRRPIEKPEYAEALIMIRATLEAGMPDLVERLVPVMGAEFTRQELAELTAFFGTPAARRWQRVELGLDPGAKRDEIDAGKRAAREARDTSTFPLARRLVAATRPRPAVPLDSQTMAAVYRARETLGLGDEYLVKRYAAHLSREELAQLVAFYTGPVGRRWIKEDPLKTPEAKREIRIWSARMASEIENGLRERGIVLPK